jgi:VanZ family protein
MRFSKKLRWTLVIIYISLIYASLFIVPWFTSKLEETGFLSWLAVSVFALFILILWILNRFLFRIRNPKAYLFLLIISLFYLAALRGMPDPVSKIHLIEYSILSFLILSVLKLNFAGIKLYSLTILIIFFVGVLDEVLQLFIPTRIFDFNDIFGNTFGGYLGIAIFWVILKYNKFKHQPLVSEGD